jgi:ribulose kinase
MVAATAAGLHPDLFSALETMAPEQTTQAADPAWAAAHDIAYDIYLQLFSARNAVETEARRLERDGLHHPMGAHR